MKKALILFAILVLAAAVAFCVIAFRDKDENSCVNHKDFNKDGACDVCDTDMTSFCETHTDKNHDGVCDYESCGASLTVTHSDNDGDGKCDAADCGANVEKSPASESENENQNDSENENENQNDSESEKESSDKLPDAPCDSCSDTNLDFKCDKCGKAIQTEAEGIKLISDGEINFSLIVSYDSLSDSERLVIESLADYLKSQGHTLNISDDTEAVTPKQVEVLINQISCRGEEYNVDPHYLGEKGYAVKTEGGKILIRAGSPEALENAIRYFKEKAFSVTDANGKLTDSVFLFSDSVELIQSDYEITSVSISGADIKNYVIAYDASEPENEKLAYEIQSLLYKQAGIWLKTVKSELVTSQSYISVASEKKSGGEGFYVRITTDKNLEFISEYSNKTLDAGMDYLNSLFDGASGDLTLTEAVINVRDIFYKDFGAVGDGTTDDYAAIKATHDYANEYRHTVVAEQGAKYYIASIASDIKISTSVRWQDATFIIDGREIEAASPERSVSLFTVISDYEPVRLDSESEIVSELNSNGKIKAGTENISFALGYPALLALENSVDGQKEIILIDENGKIDASTPLLTDFERITSIYAVRTNDAEITLEGGIFITLSNQANSTLSYVGSIMISRSNVTLSGLHYEIKDEPATTGESAAYPTFLNVLYSGNLLIKDCYIAACRSYGDSSEDEAASCSLNISNSAAVTLERCYQTNFYGLDGITPSTEYSYILCASYSKNLVLDRCILSVFRIGNGVYDAALKNSVLSDIKIDEGSTVKLENTYVYSDADS